MTPLLRVSGFRGQVSGMVGRLMPQSRAPEVINLYGPAGSESQFCSCSHSDPGPTPKTKYKTSNTKPINNTICSAFLISLNTQPNTKIATRIAPRTISSSIYLCLPQQVLKWQGNPPLVAIRLFCAYDPRPWHCPQTWFLCD